MRFFVLLKPSLIPAKKQSDLIEPFCLRTKNNVLGAVKCNMGTRRLPSIPLRYCPQANMSTYFVCQRDIPMDARYIRIAHLSMH